LFSTGAAGFAEEVLIVVLVLLAP